jgi:hypothetical protein
MHYKYFLLNSAKAATPPQKQEDQGILLDSSHHNIYHMAILSLNLLMHWLLMTMTDWSVTNAGLT